MLVKRLTQRRNMDVEISLVDGATGPQPHHQLLPADDPALSLGQRTQDAQRVAVKPQRLTIARQLAPAEVEPETPEAEALGCAVSGIFLTAQTCQPITAARDSDDKTVAFAVFVQRLFLRLPPACHRLVHPHVDAQERIPVTYPGKDPAGPVLS